MGSMTQEKSEGKVGGIVKHEICMKHETRKIRVAQVGRLRGSIVCRPHTFSASSPDASEHRLLLSFVDGANDGVDVEWLHTAYCAQQLEAVDR